MAATSFIIYPIRNPLSISFFYSLRFPLARLNGFQPLLTTSLLALPVSPFPRAQDRGNLLDTPTLVN